jgi:hypothetical protein
MLTPAEELGLAGLNLASCVRLAFHKISNGHLAALLQGIRDESLRRHLIYTRDGVDDAIRVMACPITVLPDQLSYLHYVSVTITNALKQLPDLYFEDPEVRAVLQLPADEEAWLREFWTPAQRENNPVFGRLDAMVDFISPMWKDSLRFVEPNLSCVGGLHMIPTSEQLVAEVVLPVLRSNDSRLHLEVGTDIRELLMQDVLDHLQAINRPARCICFVEFLDTGTGPDEQGELAQYYHDRYGLKVLHADPSELRLRGDEVYCQNLPVDLVYRDFEVRDLLALQRDGVDVEPHRLLFRQNRIISSITAELDQKACWEVLTDPVLTLKHFSADERQLFRRHILWTRVLSERRTQLPDGQVDELLPYVRREQEALVLKPNRSYGGKGVVIGHLLEKGEWDAAIAEALADGGRWVVQKLASIPVCDFPALGADGTIHVEPFYIVMGFAATKYGMAVLGRASQKQVVNVAQRGGICAVMRGLAPGRLLGPDTPPPPPRPTANPSDVVW